MRLYFHDRNYEKVSVQDIRKFIDRHDGIVRARHRAQEFASKARAIINEFPDSPYQRALADVTDLVTDRDH